MSKKNPKFVYESAQGMAAQYPDTFEVSSIDHLREVVQPGVYAKVCITNGELRGERIWTEVQEVDDLTVKAKLGNDPFGLDANYGDPMEYQLHHIYNVVDADGKDLA